MRFGGPEAKCFLNIAYGSERNYDKQLATIFGGFLLFSRVLIWSFAAWRAKSQLPIGIFLGINFPISRPIFEGPSAHNSYLKQAILPTPEFAGIWRAGRRRKLPFRPYLHARIPRITVVDTTPSNYTPVRYIGNNMMETKKSSRSDLVD